MDKEATLRQFFGASERDAFFAMRSSKEAFEKLLFALYFESMYQSGRHHILHAGVDEWPIRTLENANCFGKRIPLNDNGQVTVAALEAMVSQRTALVALSWANPETGVIHPIWDIAAFCRDKGIYLFVDAEPVFGRLYIRFDDLPIDYLAFEGGLFVKRRSERSTLRASAPLDPAQVERAVSAEAHFEEESLELGALRDRFETKILREIPGCEILFQKSERLPHVSRLQFEGFAEEALLYRLERDSLSFHLKRGDDVEALVADLAAHAAKLRHIAGGRA